jgi:hypothetical protein
MAEQQNIASGDSSSQEETRKQLKQQSSPSERDDQFTGGNQVPEITTNDGSVIETLDTAFHGKPGWSEGENVSGSNRADYYEARSYGKTDTDEELDELRERNKNQPKTDS